MKDINCFFADSGGAMVVVRGGRMATIIVVEWQFRDDEHAMVADGMINDGCMIETHGKDGNNWLWM